MQRGLLLHEESLSSERFGLGGIGPPPFPHLWIRSSLPQCAVSQATAYSGANLRAHSRVYELSMYVACRFNGLALPSLSPRSHPPLRSITPARAHTLALEPMPPRRGHVKSLSGLRPAGSPWIWHCAQIYLPDLGVALRMGWIRSFQEVHLPRALDSTFRAFNNPGVRNPLSCASHAVTALMYDRPMQPARG